MTDVTQARIRAHARLRFRYALKSEMRVALIGGTTINKMKPVMIRNISVDGLNFLTDLRLPVNDNFLLFFDMRIHDTDLTLPGHIAWGESEGSLFVYGVRLLLKDKQRVPYIKLLNELVLSLCPAQRNIHRMYGRINANHLFRSYTWAELES